MQGKGSGRGVQVCMSSGTVRGRGRGSEGVERKESWRRGQPRELINACEAWVRDDDLLRHSLLLSTALLIKGAAAATFVEAVAPEEEATLPIRRREDMVGEGVGRWGGMGRVWVCDRDLMR